MPRTARLDAPGVLHHIMIRGIERRKIFMDDNDRDDFLSRLENSYLQPGLHVLPGRLCRITPIFFSGQEARRLLP